MKLKWLVLKKIKSYSAYVVINKENSVSVYIDDELKYSGAVNEITLGAERNVFFTSRSIVRNNESIMCIDNVAISTGSKYKAEANIMEIR